VLDAKRSAIFFENIETARALGIQAKYQNSLPTWNMSSTLHDLGDSEKTMIEKKRACGVRFLYVFDGKIFPCSFTLSIYDLGIADYPTDYAVLDAEKDPALIRAEIVEMLQRSHYRSRGHCEPCFTPTLVAGAAEQGYSARYNLPDGTASARKVFPILASK